MSDLREISATVRFLRPEEGGRSTPIFSGYRPAFYFGDKQTDGAITLVGTEKASPGEEHLVNIKLLHLEQLNGTLKVGRVFEVKEGRKRVGLGRVTSVRANREENLSLSRESYGKGYREDEVASQSTTDQAFYPNEDDDRPYRQGDESQRDKSA